MARKSRQRLIDVGERAPEFTLYTPEGVAVTTAELLAQSGVLLAFFKITCPVCQFTLPFLNRLHRSAAATSIRIYGVSQDGARETRGFLEDYEIAYPSLIDEARSYEASNLCGITMVPTSILIGQDRTVEWVSPGFSRRDLETLALRLGGAVFRKDEFVPEYRPG